jgi:hypothetical protein
MKRETLTDIVEELQHVPTPYERINRVAATVEQTNERIVNASKVTLAFDDSPGDFLALLEEGER